MGFYEEDSIAALYFSHNDILEAIDIVKDQERLQEAKESYQEYLEKEKEREKRSVESQHQQRATNQATKFDEMVDRVMALGFSMEEAYDALAATNDVEKAVELLTKKYQKDGKPLPKPTNPKDQSNQKSQSQSQPPKQSQQQRQPQESQQRQQQQSNPQPSSRQQQPQQRQPQQQQQQSQNSRQQQQQQVSDKAAMFDKMVEILMEMGFSMEESYDGLATANSVEGAVEVITKKRQRLQSQSQSHPQRPQQPQQQQSQQRPSSQQPQQQKSQQSQQSRSQQTQQSQQQKTQPQQQQQRQPQQQQHKSTSSSPSPSSQPSKQTAPPKEFPPVDPQIEKKASELKDKGNEFFKKGDFIQAREIYEEAILLLPKGHPVTIPYLNNRAASYLKMDSFKNCIEDCTAVLLLSPNDSKAALRRV